MRTEQREGGSDGKVWQGRGQLEEVFRAGGGKGEPVPTRTVLRENGVGQWPT